VGKEQEFCKPRLTFGKQLKLTPYAWAKLIWMRDKGNTEVAGYCVTETSDPLLITDFVLIKQECTIVTFDLDSDDSAEYVERMMDEGLAPWQCMNILAHTHPGNSTDPSFVDEKNFEKAFSHPNWAIMLIIGQDGSAYCRLKMNTGPGTISLLDVVIEYGVPFNGSNPTEWENEYKAKVSKKTSFHMTGAEGKRKRLIPDAPLLDIFEEELGATRQTGSGNSSQWWDDYDSAWISVTPEEKQKLEFNEMIDEMDCYWDLDGDVVCFIANKGEDCSYYYNPDNDTWQLESEDDFQPCASPDKEGLDKKIRYWAKKNAYCRPEWRKATA